MVFVLAIWGIFASGFIPSAVMADTVYHSTHHNKPAYKRAGAPSWGSINNPPCPPTNPLYCSGPPATCTRVQNSTAFHVVSNTSTAAQLWSYYLPINDWPVSGGQQQGLLSRCASMCYGYGTPGDCLAFYMAYNVSGPKWYGNVGGDPRVSCQLFSRPLLLADFDVSNTTTRYNASAVNVNCDGTQAQNAGALVMLGGFASDGASASLASSTSIPPTSSSTTNAATSFVSSGSSSSSSTLPTSTLRQ